MSQHVTTGSGNCLSRVQSGQDDHTRSLLHNIQNGSVTDHLIPNLYCGLLMLLFHLRFSYGSHVDSADDGALNIVVMLRLIHLITQKMKM